MESTDFARDLYLECIKEKPGNVFISPLSVSSALTLLSQSAGDNTYDELKQVLHLGDDKSAVANQFFEHHEALDKNAGETTLSIANRIYVQQGNQLNKSFEEVATSKFKSGIESLNFTESEKSAGTINKFVEEKTNGKIQDLFKPAAFNCDTQSVLVNAIYFKGTWEKLFDRDKTSKGDFFNSKTEKVQVDYMYQDNRFNVGYNEDLGALIIALKYANSNLEFVIVIPYEIDTSLLQLEEKLKGYDLAKLNENMDYEKCKIYIPKFKVEYDIKLNGPLKNMGITEIFSDTANLRGMFDPEKQVKVSEVVHKAVFEIDEEGSEASSGTGIECLLTSAPGTYFANVPFMYFIRENTTNTIIFVGRIARFD